MRAGGGTREGSAPMSHLAVPCLFLLFVFNEAQPVLCTPHLYRLV